MFVPRTQIENNYASIYILACHPGAEKISYKRMISAITDVTTHLLSIERADWPKPHDMFKSRDANVWQREHDAVARLESRCVIKAKHVCWSVNSFDFALEKLHSC